MEIDTGNNVATEDKKEASNPSSRRNKQNKSHRRNGQLIFKHPKPLNKYFINYECHIFLFRDVMTALKAKMKDDDIPFGCGEIQNPLTKKPLTEIVPQSAIAMEFKRQKFECYDVIGMITYIACNFQLGKPARLRNCVSSSDPTYYSNNDIALIGLAYIALKTHPAFQKDYQLCKKLEALYIQDVTRLDQKLTAPIQYLYQNPEKAIKSMLFAQRAETFIWLLPPSNRVYEDNNFKIAQGLYMDKYENKLKFHMHNFVRILKDSFRQHVTPEEQNPAYAPFWIANAEKVTIPVIDYSPDPDKIKKFLASGNPDHALIMRDLKYISFENLLQYLETALQDFFDSIEADDTWVVVLLTDEQYDPAKSNVWIFRLILKFLWPKMKFRLPEYIVYTVDQLKDKQVSNCPNLVFFDDLTYTGRQMSETLDGVSDFCKYQAQNFHVVVACMPEHSEIDDLDLTPREIFIHKGCTIRPTMTKDLEKGYAFAVYAQHKLPDALSCFDVEIAQVIRNCDAQYTGGFEMNPCPIVPYKQEDGMGPDLSGWCE